MKVELRSHTGRNIATGREETFRQHRVFVDETLVGYKSWTHGSPVAFVGRIPSTDKEEILEQIDLILGDSPEGIEPPEAPNQDSTENNEVVFDDFDS